MLGVIYTLLASITFGINAATVRRGVLTISVTQVVATSMPVGFLMFVTAAALFGQLGKVIEFSPRNLAFLASAGVVHFVFGRYCAYRAVQAMGANLAAPVQQWSLLVSIGLAIGVLNEVLDVLKVFGIVLLVLGPAIVAGARGASAKEKTASQSEVASKRESASASAQAKPQFKPKLLQGYSFSILSCFFWGSSPVLVRAGLEDSGLGLAGGVVSYGAATLAVFLILLLPVARRDAAGIKPESIKWLAWIGVTVCLSQIFMYCAMAIAPVTVVQPLMRISIIFGVIFSWMLNRDHEVFDAGVLAAVILAVTGAISISIDSGIVLDALGSPAWLANLLEWHWPARN